MMNFAGPGTCSNGDVFYTCGQGFQGCCSTDPCSIGICPNLHDDSDDEYVTTIVSTEVVVETAFSSLSSSTEVHTTFATVAPPLTGIIPAPSSSTIVSTATSVSTSASDSASASTGSGALSVPSQTTIPDSPVNGDSGGQHSKKLDTPAIIGISIGGAIAFFILLLGVWFLIRRSRRRLDKRDVSSQQITPAPVYYENKFMGGDEEAQNVADPGSRDVFAPFGGRVHMTDQTKNANPLQSNPLNKQTYAVDVAEDSQQDQMRGSHLNQTDDTYLNNGVAAANPGVPHESLESDSAGTARNDKAQLHGVAQTGNSIKQDQKAQGGTDDEPMQLDSQPVYAELPSAAVSKESSSGSPNKPGTVMSVSPISPDFPIGTALTTPYGNGAAGGAAEVNNNRYPTKNNNPFTRSRTLESENSGSHQPHENNGGTAGGDSQYFHQGGKNHGIPSHPHHPLSLTPGTFGTQLSIQQQRQESQPQQSSPSSPSPLPTPPVAPTTISPPGGGGVSPLPELPGQNRFIDYGIYIAGPASEVGGDSELGGEPSSSSSHPRNLQHSATLNAMTEEERERGDYHVASWNKL